MSAQRRPRAAPVSGPGAWLMVAFLRRGNAFQAWLLGPQQLVTPSEWQQAMESFGDLEQLADEYRTFRSSAAGTVELPGPELAALCDQPITVRKAADMLRISEGMVRRLCRQDVLDAERGPGGAWAIDRESVAFYRDARTA